MTVREFPFLCVVRRLNLQVGCLVWVETDRANDSGDTVCWCRNLLTELKVRLLGRLCIEYLVFSQDFESRHMSKASNRDVVIGAVFGVQVHNLSASADLIELGDNHSFVSGDLVFDTSSEVERGMSDK